MKNLFFLAIALILLTSCEKNFSESGVQSVDVQFSIENPGFGLSLKSDGPEAGNVPNCSAAEPEFATFTIDGVDYTTEVYYANGKLVTQPIKVILGEGVSTKDLTITAFDVYSGSLSSPILAAPLQGSDFAGFVSSALPLTATVNSFNKIEYAVDVLCYEQSYYDNFGFTWFRINGGKVVELPFFGDICTGKLEQYGVQNSPYVDQLDNYDLIAGIDLVISKQDGNGGFTELNRVTNITSDNTVLRDVVKIYWPDYDAEDELYKLDLYVHLPQGSSIVPTLLKTWEFEDSDFGVVGSNAPQAGNDGVVDFVVGECAYPDADIVFAPHQNLPQGEVSMKLGTSHSYGSYTQVTITGEGLEDAYDIPIGTPISTWCGDKSNTIGTSTYTVVVQSSLSNLDNIVANTKLTEAKISQLNYLFNHINDVFPEFTATVDAQGNTVYGGVGYQTIQNAIWHITNGYSVSGEAATLASNAITNGTGYIPRPGEWAGVFFYDEPGNAFQMQFTIVDP